MWSRLLCTRRKQLRWIKCLTFIICMVLLIVLFHMLYQHLLLRIHIREIQNVVANRSLITFRLSNRWGMGNEMFALASAYGIMSSYEQGNWLLCIDPNAFILNVFHMEAILKCRADILIQYLNADQHQEFAYGFYDTSMRHLSTGRHMVVGRFLQSWRYFKDIEYEVFRLFTFKEAILRKAHQVLTSTIERHTVCQGCFENFMKIGVHIRRGNMATNRELIDQGYIIADGAYLKRAMAFYQKKFPEEKIIFVICSDNIDWCRDELHYRNDVVFVSTGQPEMDLAVLSLCDSSIITVGTFGWWSAWLANGTTVYYKNWPREKSQLAYLTNHKDYFPSSWIGL